MCIAIPAKVLSVDGLLATVERYGERLTVSLALLSEPVCPGDYLVIQAQRFAVDKMDQETAAKAYRLFDALLAPADAMGESPERAE